MADGHRRGQQARPAAFSAPCTNGARASGSVHAWNVCIEVLQASTHCMRITVCSKNPSLLLQRQRSALGPYSQCLLTSAQTLTPHTYVNCRQTGSVPDAGPVQGLVNNYLEYLRKVSQADPQAQLKMWKVQLKLSLDESC